MGEDATTTTAAAPSANPATATTAVATTGPVHATLHGANHAPVAGKNWAYTVHVTDASGKVTTWNFEMASTPALERGGWSRKTLPVGTQVTVAGFAGRNVVERAIVTAFRGPDGKEFFVPKLGN